MEFIDIKIRKPSPGENILYFYDAINTETAKTFVKELNSLRFDLNYIEMSNQDKLEKFFGIKDYPKERIKIMLNTPGGMCYAGFAICDNIRAITERPVDICCSGMVMSMGIPFLLSVPLENRTATKDTTFMIHQVSSASWGKVQDMIEDAEESKRLHDMIWKIIEENSKITKKQLQDCYEHKKDWFITAQEALDLGLISAIV